MAVLTVLTVAMLVLAAAGAGVQAGFGCKTIVVMAGVMAVLILLLQILDNALGIRWRARWNFYTTNASVPQSLHEAFERFSRLLFLQFSFLQGIRVCWRKPRSTRETKMPPTLPSHSWIDGCQSIQIPVG